MAQTAFLNGESNNGTLTVTAPAVSGVTWNCSSIQVSQSGGAVGPNAKITVWDGAVGTGTKLWSAYLLSPGALIQGTGGLGGSVGIIQDLPLPMTPSGLRSIQGTPGNAMNIQVTGTGLNNVTLNARCQDATPTLP